jgi:hypothetical protein
VRQFVIENPVTNSAFEEPGKHYLLTDRGITNEIVLRRPSANFISVVAAGGNAVTVDLHGGAFVVASSSRLATSPKRTLSAG